MALSIDAQDIVRVAKGLFEDPNGNTTNRVTYIVEFEDTRKDKSSRIAQITFTLKEPMDEDEIDERLNNIFPKIALELENDVAAYAATKLLANRGYTARHISQSSRRSIVDVKIYSEIAEEVEEGVNVGVRPSRGRGFMSRKDLRAALEFIMKENMLKIMTSGSAGTGRNTPLRNRTGRFVNTSQVDDVVVTNAAAKRPTLSLYYKYMIYPYQVFDPLHTRSPQMNLASAARNPQRIIGESLAKAAKTMLGDRYRIIIKQVL